MGCKSSKPNPRPINTYFPTTNQASEDEFYNGASQFLKTMETLRHKIEDSKPRGTVLAGTNRELESPYAKAVQVLFWALSAAGQGQIAKSGLTITEQPPYVSVDTKGLCKETIELFQTLQEYLGILIETPQTLRPLSNKLQMLRDGEAQIKKSTNPKTTSKAANEKLKKLDEGLTTSAKILAKIPEEQVNAFELIKYMKMILSTSDEIGAKAFAAKLLRPADIFRWVDLETKKAAQRNSIKSPKLNSQTGQKGEPILTNQGTNADNTSKSPSLDQKGGANEVKVENTQNMQNSNQVVFPNDVHIQDKNQGNNQPIHDTMNNQNIKSDERTLEHQRSQREQTDHKAGTHGDYIAPSFGEIRNNQANNPRFIPNQFNTAGMMNDYKDNQGQQAEANARVTENFYSQENGGERQKSQYYLGERGMETMTRDPTGGEMNKSTGGYLSSGGKKQAGIMQGDENIMDDEFDTRHSLANESVMIKNFIEKAHAHFDMKN
jgi:hypothetical protein